MIARLGFYGNNNHTPFCAGLARKPQSGSPVQLDATHKTELQTFLGQGAKSAGDLTDRWTKIVADRLFKKWGGRKRS